MAFVGMLIGVAGETAQFVVLGGCPKLFEANIRKFVVPFGWHRVLHLLFEIWQFFMSMTMTTTTEWITSPIAHVRGIIIFDTYS